MHDELHVFFYQYYLLNGGAGIAYFIIGIKQEKLKYGAALCVKKSSYILD